MRLGLTNQNLGSDNATCLSCLHPVSPPRGNYPYQNIFYLLQSHLACHQFHYSFLLLFAENISLGDCENGPNRRTPRRLRVSTPTTIYNHSSSSSSSGRNTSNPPIPFLQRQRPLPHNTRQSEKCRSAGTRITACDGIHSIIYTRSIGRYDE